MLTCPKCGAEIPRTNINPRLNYIMCPNGMCNSYLVMQPPDEWRAKKKFDVPQTVKVEDLGNRLVIKIYPDETQTIRWIKVMLMGVIPALLMIVFTVMTFVLKLPLLLFMTIFCPFMLLIIGLASSINSSHTKITVNSDFIEVDASQDQKVRSNKHIYGIYLTQMDVQSEGGYTLWAVSEKTRKRLLDGLPENEAFYIAQVLRNYLEVNM